MARAPSTLWLRLIRSALALSGGLLSSAVYAQCPDGLPPPCRRAVVTAVAASKNPPTNPRLWIVVPFSNVMHAQDIDWLGDASVNLLTLDMSRWTDVNVVPDKRVGDLLREMARSSDAAAGDTRRGVELAGAREVTLTLNDGLAIARRAGAGMLVMGDIFKLGNGARLTATVFDVRSGRQVRAVTRQATAQDSLLSVFGPLARGVLDVPPPDAKAGDAGTQNLAAYQEYLAGVKAYNRFDLPEAGKRLLRAIALDSTFALAHLEYSLVAGWGDASLGTRGGLDQRSHALLAQRFGTNLPKRERMLIDSRVASTNDDNSRACEIAKALVAQDSTDVESLYLLGECSYHDPTVDPSPTDPRIGTFRGSLNTAIRAFSKILELDPGFYAAFEPLQDILGASQRTLRCPRAGIAPDQCVRWQSFVLRAGDTLQTVPVREGFDSLFFVQAVKATNDHVHLINLGLAKGFAKRWFDSDTTSEQARGGLARAALAAGDLETAYAQLVRLPVRGTQDNFQVLRMRVEVAAKLGHGAEARAMFDSLVKAVPDVPGIDLQRGSIELMFGRLTRFDRGMAAAGARLGPEAVAYQKQVGRALLGLPREDMARDEAAFFASMKDAGCVGECRLLRLQPTLTHVPHVPVGALANDSLYPVNNFRFTPVRALLAKDTANIHAWARARERDSHVDVADANQDFGFGLLAADLYLVVHDSVSALRAVRFFVDSAMTFQSVGASGVGGLTNVMGSAFWPRAMLLRADLAAAVGQRDEAKKWYARVLDLWADADSDLQPTITRIRAALTRLSH